MNVLDSVAARPVGIENTTATQQVQRAQESQPRPTQTSNESAANTTSSLTPVRSDNLASASALSVSADIAFSLESQNGSTSVSGNVSVNVQFAARGNSNNPRIQPVPDGENPLEGIQIDISLLANLASEPTETTPSTTEQLIQGALDISQPVQGNRIDSNIFNAVLNEELNETATEGALASTAARTDALQSSTALDGNLSQALSVDVSVQITLPEEFNPPSIQPAGETVAQNAALAANPANVRGPDVATVDIAV